MAIIACCCGVSSSSSLEICCGPHWPATLYVAIDPDPAGFGNPGGGEGTLNLITDLTAVECDRQLNPSGITPRYALEGDIFGTTYFCVRSLNKFCRVTEGFLGTCDIEFEATIWSCSPFHAVATYEFGGVTYTVEITE